MPYTKEHFIVELGPHLKDIDYVPSTTEFKRFYQESVRHDSTEEHERMTIKNLILTALQEALEKDPGYKTKEAFMDALYKQKNVPKVLADIILNCSRTGKFKTDNSCYAANVFALASQAKKGQSNNSLRVYLSNFRNGHVAVEPQRKKKAPTTTSSKNATPRRNTSNLLQSTDEDGPDDESSLDSSVEKTPGDSKKRRPINDLLANKGDFVLPQIKRSRNESQKDEKKVIEEMQGKINEQEQKINELEQNLKTLVLKFKAFVQQVGDQFKNF